jgi:hypothetical protein
MPHSSAHAHFTQTPNKLWASAHHRRLCTAHPNHTHPLPPQGWFELKNNTSVYVSGLPFDTNEKEVAAVFAKCGIIKEGPDLQPRIKLYRWTPGVACAIAWEPRSIPMLAY